MSVYCLPQLYTSSTKLCVYTPFADTREVIDHIWKYHSYLLSCCRRALVSSPRERRTETTLFALFYIEHNKLGYEDIQQLTEPSVEALNP